jgi:hypothetical protein
MSFILTEGCRWSAVKYPQTWKVIGEKTGHHFLHRTHFHIRETACGRQFHFPGIFAGTLVDPGSSQACVAARISWKDLPRRLGMHDGIETAPAAASDNVAANEKRRWN